MHINIYTHIYNFQVKIKIFLESLLSSLVIICPTSSFSFCIEPTPFSLVKAFPTSRYLSCSFSLNASSHAYGAFAPPWFLWLLHLFYSQLRFWSLLGQHNSRLQIKVYHYRYHQQIKAVIRLDTKQRLLDLGEPSQRQETQLYNCCIASSGNTAEEGLERL